MSILMDKDAKNTLILLIVQFYARIVGEIT